MGVYLLVDDGHRQPLGEGALRVRTGGYQPLPEHSLPLSQKGLDVDLPSQTTANPEVIDRQIVVEYQADRQLSINKQPVALAALESRLREIYSGRRDKTLYIAGAGSLRYGDIVAVVDAGKGAGVERVGIITGGMRR